MLTFEEANKAIHKVEDQWHHPILTRYGFTPLTKEATGFVRSYKYMHPSGIVVQCTTGSSSDYWAASTGGRGYWSDLEPFLKQVSPT
jgi:hypothetical protein